MRDGIDHIRLVFPNHHTYLPFLEYSIFKSPEGLIFRESLSVILLIIYFCISVKGWSSTSGSNRKDDAPLSVAFNPFG